MIMTREVWKRERNSGRFGSKRIFVTSVKVQSMSIEGTKRVVIDAYSVDRTGERTGQTVRPGSRASWFTPDEWEQVCEAVGMELWPEDYKDDEDKVGLR